MSDFEQDFEAQIQAGWDIVQGDKRHYSEEAALNYFRALCDRYPEQARAFYELASVFDFLGREDEAIPIYWRAIENGLEPPHLQRAIVQLGSSLRNVGQTGQAISVLRAGCAQFPNNEPMRLFLALSLHSQERHTQAFTTLMDIILGYVDSDELRLYRNALRRYTDDLGG